MFSFFKKDKIITEIIEPGLKIKVKEAKDGQRKVNIISETPNKNIEITSNGNMFEYTIYDVHKGSQQFKIPKHIHMKVFNEYLKNDLR